MRSQRRHDRERLKKKRLDYYGGWMKCPAAKNENATRDFCKRLLRKIGIAIDTPTPCSSPGCCGNPRKRRKNVKTIQERRKLQREESE